MGPPPAGLFFFRTIRKLIMSLHASLARIAPPAPITVPPASLALDSLLAGRRLDQEASHALFTALVEGGLSDHEIAAMLIALRVRGETADEMIGAARALRAADTDFERPDYLFADCCGTGGDGSGSINISTAVAFVAAAAGLPVAKHGNRSVTSRCGSADVLEQLGARIDLPPERSRQILDATGFCFLFAPFYHPGLRHAGPVRRALGVRTIMNLLGPCLNPAEPAVQLLGVADLRMIEPIALTLTALGVERALVVHGAGLDEVALHGETDAIRVIDGEIERLRIRPEDAGLDRVPAEALAGGDPAENAARLLALLSGGGSPVERDVVALNSAALLMTAGIATSLTDGVQLARTAIESGAVHDRLRQFVDASNG